MLEHTDTYVADIIFCDYHLKRESHCRVSLQGRNACFIARFFSKDLVGSYQGYIIRDGKGFMTLLDEMDNWKEYNLEDVLTEITVFCFTAFVPFFLLNPKLDIIDYMGNCSKPSDSLRSNIGLVYTLNMKHPLYEWDILYNAGRVVGVNVFSVDRSSILAVDRRFGVSSEVKINSDIFFPEYWERYRNLDILL